MLKKTSLEPAEASETLRQVESNVGRSPTCLCPAGEVFIPFYYGKAIESIVATQSMGHLAQPVLRLSALAVAR